MDGLARAARISASNAYTWGIVSWAVEIFRSGNIGPNLKGAANTSLELVKRKDTPSSISLRFISVLKYIGTFSHVIQGRREEVEVILLSI
jgi:hypothetical protein